MASVKKYNPRAIGSLALSFFLAACGRGDGKSSRPPDAPLCAPFPTFLANGDVIRGELSQLSERSLRVDAAYLASPELAGRGSGQPGFDLAADYVAQRFAAIGLQPPAGWAHHFQEFVTEQYRPALITSKGEFLVQMPGPLKGRNVVGVLQPKTGATDEYLVVGAHLDHLGAREGWVFPGADDNASGVAAMLALAEWLVSSRIELERTVLFIAFGAEEHGLIGSRQYVANPAVPLGATKFMLNLDMIGRAHGKIRVAAAETAPICDGEDGVRMASDLSASSLVLSFDQQAMSLASDHQPFIKKGVPSLMMFSGIHSDYHAPSDTVDLLDFDGLVQVSRMAAAQILIQSKVK